MQNVNQIPLCVMFVHNKFCLHFLCCLFQMNTDSSYEFLNYLVFNYLTFISFGNMTEVKIFHLFIH